MKLKYERDDSLHAFAGKCLLVVLSKLARLAKIFGAKLFGLTHGLASWEWISWRSSGGLAMTTVLKTRVRGSQINFLSIDTESINFDHHLRCGGWLNFEFSKRENIRDGSNMFIYLRF